MAEHKERLSTEGSSENYDHKTESERGYVDIRGSAAGTSSRRRPSMTPEEIARRNLNAKLANPLAGYSYAELEEMGAEYAEKHGLGDKTDVLAFKKGAVLAQDPLRYDDLPMLDAEDKAVLRKEFEHRWTQPKLLYLVIVLCSTAAAVQGMDETVVNGAQLFYTKQFGIHGKDPRSTWLTGLVKFCLGFGIGPKSATVPIYAAETTPPAIRGAMVMMWQMWTAFGIMVGYTADLAFLRVPDPHNIVGLNWRLMLGSAMLPAVIVCCFVYMCPESPRWYMSKGRHAKAYKSMCRLRYTKVQAARDVFYMHTLLEAESSMVLGQSKILEMVTIPRNRRALVGSEIVMFMQQFCGVNVIAYYSSAIFEDSGFSNIDALSASLGFGIINFIFALPAVYTIDTFGRRNLLLTTFPLMSLFLFFTGFSFFIPDDDSHHTARIACIATGIYLFGIVYSPGEGPVPFTYSAEAYPLYIRSYGMSLATATTWFFNFVLSITWPSLQAAFTTQGAFSWYAGWNIVGFFLVLFFLPETKGKTLEELDQVFSVPTRIHAAYGARQIPYFFRRYILRRDIQPERLYEQDDVIYHESTFQGETETESEKRV
ncbi:MAG: hypothetical protein M1813_000141 [Trichoglossum hirsutum]|nr:MAG: hypothetical protein M1813_000141 [Trichoglossum hirsutum]